MLRAAARSCFFWLLLPLVFPISTRAQPAPLTGVVVDAASGQPVPFAVVEIRAQRVGVQATEQGTFTLALPAALAATDSLRVSSLGFMPQMLAVPSVSPCRLALRPLAISLPEAVVRAGRALLVRLGPVEKGDKFGYSGGAKLSAENSTGWQVARYFAAPPAGTIQAVRFYVKPATQCGSISTQAPFRVRLYAADGPQGAPGTDLITTSLLTAAAKKGWHEVDLSKLQLPVPAVGFYVAMEWLYTKPEFGCVTHYLTPTKEKKTGYSYGQSLGGYLNAEPQTAWYLSAGYPWQQFKADRFLNKGNPNAAIQAIIQPD